MTTASIVSVSPLVSKRATIKSCGAGAALAHKPHRPGPQRIRQPILGKWPYAQ